MAKPVKLTVIGQRSNNVILFTCPYCEKENSITYEMPKDFYKESRDKTCSKCRKPCTIRTP
jgi:hypothetical protein